MMCYLPWGGGGGEWGGGGIFIEYTGIKTGRVFRYIDRYKLLYILVINTRLACRYITPWDSQPYKYYS